jgi:hypothetical protein
MRWRVQMDDAGERADDADERNQTALAALLYTRDLEVSTRGWLRDVRSNEIYSQFSWDIQRSTSLLIKDLNDTDSLP